MARIQLGRTRAHLLIGLIDEVDRTLGEELQAHVEERYRVARIGVGHVGD